MSHPKQQQKPGQSGQKKHQEQLKSATNEGMREEPAEPDDDARVQKDKRQQNLSQTPSKTASKRGQ